MTFEKEVFQFSISLFLIHTIRIAEILLEIPRNSRLRILENAFPELISRQKRREKSREMKNVVKATKQQGFVIVGTNDNRECVAGKTMVE